MLRKLIQFMVVVFIADIAAMIALVYYWGFWNSVLTVVVSTFILNAWLKVLVHSDDKNPATLALGCVNMLLAVFPGPVSKVLNIALLLPPVRRWFFKRFVIDAIKVDMGGQGFGNAMPGGIFFRPGEGGPAGFGMPPRPPGAPGGLKQAEGRVIEDNPFEPPQMPQLPPPDEAPPKP